MLVAVGEAAHDDTRQPVLTLEPHHVLAVEDGIEHKASGPVRNDFAPVCHARIGDGRLDDAEILGALRVGRDDQPVAVVLDRILMADLARLDDARRHERRVGIDEVRFARLVVVRVDEHELRRLSGGDGDVEADVLLRIDEDVILDRRADGVAVDEQWTVMLIEADVKQGLAVVRPDDAAARIGNAVGQVLAAGEIAHANGVQFRPLVVAGVGKQLVVGTVMEAAEIPVGFAFGLDIAIEQNLLVLARALPTADERILPSGNELSGVGERPVGCGN